MRYESEKTVRGNIGVSYVSQDAANSQAREMDEGLNSNCVSCLNCSRCTSCVDRVDCSRRSTCSDH
jgi:hypothetical protein